MPSVEMRRSTRVFVPKAKDGELVRVLRSGRRLWVESGEVKSRGGKNGDAWSYPLIKEEDHHKNCWHDVGPTSMEVDEKKPAPEPVFSVPSLRYERSDKKNMFGNIYSRKRNGFDSKKGDFDKKFGLHFVRRQRRKIHVFDDGGDDRFMSVVVGESSARFSSLLGCVLRYMARRVVGLRELSSFLLSSPISPVFASFGIHFLRVFPCTLTKSFCKIFGTKQFIPLFTMDFSAAPLCFLHLHASIWFRVMRLSCLIWIDFNRGSESANDFNEPLPLINDHSDQSLTGVVDSIKEDPKIKKLVNPFSGVGKLGSRNVQFRNGVTTRSGSKRRRRSLRPRKARNPSPFVLHKASGPSVPRNRALKKIPSSLPLGTNQVLRRSARRSSADENNLPKLSSCPMSLMVDTDSHSCSVNLLVVESEKCYRVEGAEITLDDSDSNECVLAVRKDGLKLYSLKAQREMRPCTTNRFTHAVIWAGENGWKLEFPERKEWSVFKELYKLCGERNVVPTSPVIKIIPVPVVREVTNAWDSTSATFKRPDLYIKVDNDELSRVLLSRKANYDMDFEDEEWLRKLNSGLGVEENVSEEAFELMIDAFEKACYCNPEGCNDEKAAVKYCVDLASSAVTEDVYSYWLKKRERNRGPLSMIFQLNQPMRAQVITKPVLRKKRSLKRQNTQQSQRGRGKDSIVLQAIAAEQTAADEQNAILKVEEAKALVDKSMELAIVKRQRAQLLMENADLVMYRATMALRIADAAQTADIHQAAAHFLD